MRVTVIATVTRAGKWPGSRASVQIPTFALEGVTSLQNAVDVSLKVLDPHADALLVSIGAVDDDANYISAVAERDNDKNPLPIRYST